jgi:peptidoglycan/LPS O-acetylase OafA/YrhL
MVSDVQSPAAGEAPAATVRRRTEAPLREDVQGLRVVAVMLVVLFHLWPNRITGGYVGVDVFFVISGYLITGHLLRHPPRTGRDLATFWARRIRRLLPASLLVLAVTLVAARMVAPALSWASTAREAVASALYVENWSLASKAVDYLAADAAPTPVQHFWSLSTEEQFYLVWPILVLAIFALHRLTARRAGRPVQARPLVVAGMGLVLAGSLASSLRLTADDPARAYFVTPTRAWEFAAGGLVAALAGTVGPRLPAAARAGFAWAGLAAIVAAGLVLTSATPFPGSAALLPVLGTAAVIAARADGTGSPAPFWRLPGVQWVGGASYSIYLWHWPLIVLVPYVSGGQLGRLDKATILVLTFVLSGLTKRHVEDRFRFGQRTAGLAGAYRLAAVGMAVVVALGLALHQEAGWRAGRAQRELDARLAGDDPCFGAGAAVKGPRACPVDPDAALVPELSLAGEDKPDAYPDDCFNGSPYDGRQTCTYGNGPTKVALVGNSHAGQWLPALQRIAERRGWTITTYLVSVCNVTTARMSMPNPEQADNCEAYARWVFDQTKGSAYDLVITSERQSTRIEGTDWAGTQQAAERAYRGYLTRWAQAGTRVVVIKDQVVPGNDVGRIPECLAKADGDPAACTWSYRRPVPTDPSVERWMDPLWSAAKALDDPRVRWIELDDLFCVDGTCQPVVGGVVTFVDASHYTATFATTMWPYLDERITGALG